MRKISRRGLRLTAAAAGAGVIAVAGLAATAHAGPADASTSAPQRATLAIIPVPVSPMPQGAVTFGRDRRGDVDVTVNAFGLTPGSSHGVELVSGSGRVIARFSTLTANSVGRARDETLHSHYRGALGPWWLVVRNGVGRDRVSAQPIALTGRDGDGQRTYVLVPVEFGPGGRNWGTPRGSAVIVYNRHAKTISVTVSASGFTPGAHAAHIHVGSCVSQGPVQYMLGDFIANARGRIVHQTRVVTGVMSPPPARGWYLNLHQGNTSNILYNGSPTIFFRPLLCGDITPRGDMVQAQPGTAVSYGFTTLNDRADPTFNQLLGINNDGTIAGYFGSGAAGHPNKGYRLLPPHGHGSFQSENFPGSVQTQVTGLNNKGVTVGFWSSTNNASMVNDNSGFWARNGAFFNANFPAGAPASPPVDQLLGVNDSGVAVGFWTGANGSNHGYLVNINTGTFGSVTDPNAPSASLTAAAVNDNGGIAGFYTNKGGKTDGFLKSGGGFIDLSVPGASSTMALGVNDKDEVVGTYAVGSGNGAATHGFSWTLSDGFQTIDDPHGHGTTTINGVNDAGDLVGFYVDSAGNTDGMLAAPKAP